MAYPFDPITWAIEKELSGDVGREIYNEYVEHVDRYLAQCVRANQQKTLKLLFDASRDLDRQLKILCARHSADQWLSLVRRIPPSVFGNAWAVHATLAILKYSSWETDSTFGHAYGDKKFGVMFSYELNDIHDAWRIAVMCAHIANLLVWRRTCSKGGRVKKAERTFRLATSPKVDEAIEAYERRRPKDWIFSDEATPVATTGDEERRIIYLAALAEPLRLEVPRANLTLSLGYSVQFLPIQSFRRTLRFYEEPLKDLYHVGSDELLQVFCAMTENILHTMLPVDVTATGWRTNVDRADTDAWHRLEFTSQLLHKGYVCFPRERIEQALACVAIGGVEGDRNQLVRSFLEAFVMKPENREKIDVLALDATPFAFETPGDNCYFDLTLFRDFVRGLLQKVREEWYSSAHGDRFNLLLNGLIKERVPEARIIGAKETLTTRGGITAIPDLLVQCGRVLFSVECKAHSKSRAFWRGDLAAIRQRAKAVAEAVKQAKAAADVVRACLAENLLNVDGVDEVQWVVCGTTQEFLAPVDRYGMIDAEAGIPRVCTHEEFIGVLASRLR